MNSTNTPPSEQDLIAPDLLREATAFSARHDRPLLRRLRPQTANAEGTAAGLLSDGEPIILAVSITPGYYRFEAVEEDAGTVPRWGHLEWVREQLRDGEVPPSLARALTPRRARTMAAQGEAPLSRLTYGRWYGGPSSAGPALTAWLEEAFDIRGEEELDWDDAFLFLIRHYSPGYIAFARVLDLCRPDMPWCHPDTGHELGDISASDGMGDLVQTEFATGHVAVSCVQWTADLAGIPLRVRSIEEST